MHKSLFFHYYALCVCVCVRACVLHCIVDSGSPVYVYMKVTCVYMYTVWCTVQYSTVVVAAQL